MPSVSVSVTSDQVAEDLALQHVGRSGAQYRPLSSYVVKASEVLAGENWIALAAMTWSMNCNDVLEDAAPMIAETPSPRTLGSRSRRPCCRCHPSRRRSGRG